MKRKLKFGIIETGNSTLDSIIIPFASTHEVEIVALYHQNKSIAKKLTKRYEIEHKFSSPKEVIDHPEVDAVIVKMWPEKHESLISLAIENHKHILVYGDLATNFHAAKKLVELKNRHPHLIAEKLPTAPSLHYDDMIKNLIKRKLGKLIHVEFRINQGTFPDSKESYTWLNNRELAGNNIADLGKYYQVVLRWLGPLTEVFAKGEIVVSERLIKKDQFAPVDIPDHVMIIGRFEQLETTFLLTYSQVAGFRQENECWLHGQLGTLKIDFNKPAIYLGSPGDKQMKELPMKDVLSPHTPMEEFFIEYMSTNQMWNAKTFETGLDELAFMDAIWSSMQSGKRLSLLQMEKV